MLHDGHTGLGNVLAQVAGGNDAVMLIVVLERFVAGREEKDILGRFLDEPLPLIPGSMGSIALMRKGSIFVRMN